jgi:Tol biopolymer transport system component
MSETSPLTMLLTLTLLGCHDSVAPPSLPLPIRDRVVFESRPDADSPADIFSMRFDGSDLRRLTSTSVDERCPAISPDGNWIAYSVFVNGPSGQQVALWLMQANGEDPKPIAVIPAPVQCPVWSRSSDLVAVSTYVPVIESPSRETLQVFDLSGNEVTHYPEAAFFLFEFSADGQKFLVSYANCMPNGCGGPDLAVITRSGGFDRWLTGGMQNGSFVSEGGTEANLNPNGSLVVYVCSNGADHNSIPIRALCTKPWEGTSTKSVLTDANTPRWPRFSPDGTRIAYTCTVGTQAGICLIDSDGSHMMTVPSRSVYDAPSWTADGTRLVFTCEARDICVMDVHAGSVASLTKGVGVSTNPSVSRNSS